VSGIVVTSYDETLPLLRAITNDNPVAMVVGYVPANHPTRGAGAGAGAGAEEDDEEEDRFKDAKEFSRIMKLEKDLAAAQVQAVIRGNSGRLSSGSGEPDDDDRFKDAREHAKLVKMEKELELEEAAAQMQAVMRGRKARSEKKQMDKATTQVQAVMRGRAARRESASPAKAKAEDLSELLKAETVAIFHAMDVDNDGSVTKEEASRFFKSFGKLNAQAMFNEVDVSRSVDDDVDVITLAEWVGFWRNVKGSGYSEDEMREELANMASGQSWVDFNDGRSTEEHGTPPIPRRAGSDAQPASFKPKRSPLVPEAAPAAAGEKAAEEKAGEKAKAPLNKLPVRTNPVSYKPAEERKASLSRQKTASEWMAEQTYKFISLADFQKKWTGEAQPGDVISKQDAKASEMHAASHAAPHVADATGPPDADMDEYVGVWRAAGLENRDEFLKAMALPWILRQIAKALPQPDNVFFRDDEGHLRSHSTSLGKTTEETYIQDGTSTKTFKGVTSTVTYRWEGKVLTYSAVKSGAPEEEASSRRWIEPDGVTMIAESLFRKDKSQPWSKLRRTWTLDHK
tara:strand:+ start:702 stop:2408 length:1707 start_codon:yes stop_codon:yes gene_type:complete